MGSGLVFFRTRYCCVVLLSFVFRLRCAPRPPPPSLPSLAPPTAICVRVTVSRARIARIDQGFSPHLWIAGLREECYAGVLGVRYGEDNPPEEARAPGGGRGGG